MDGRLKVLIIGSGPIVIGQAAEFDYAGTQACRALREEGIETVLVNSNPATIMTDAGVADVTYIEPLTVEVLERIIARERPDGLLPTLGGQTGLNLAVALAEAGVLERYGVRLLGTPLAAIQQSEDREAFKQLLISIGEPVPESVAARSVDDAVSFAARVGYPVVVRPAFTLGGTGGGVAKDVADLRAIAARGISASPIGQVLVERSLVGWKEIEYEVMRDRADTCITVCNMENIDPMGVHTGDSIVVAPSQTLTDKEYQMLRSAALRIIRALGIEGGCNIQFGLHPDRSPTADAEAQVPYYVIEVNPRVSRSSALASKATGYPIARVAAKIAIGKRLDEIPNAVTKKTSAAFEPALDYVVVKIPRWPFDKFPPSRRRSRRRSARSRSRASACCGRPRRGSRSPTRGHSSTGSSRARPRMTACGASSRRCGAAPRWTRFTTRRGSIDFFSGRWRRSSVSPRSSCRARRPRPICCAARSASDSPTRTSPR